MSAFLRRYGYLVPLNGLADETTDPKEKAMDLITELRAVSAFEYKTVDTNTLAGLRRAERLQAAGWKIIRSGLFSIQFERRKATPPTKAELVKAVLDYAVANYERDGWDFLIECHEEAEVAAAIGGAKTVRGAIRAVAKHFGLKLHAEVRQSIENEAF